MTGGLGPTQDDLTKETVAEVWGKSLFYTKKALRGLKLFYQDKPKNDGQ